MTDGIEPPARNIHMVSEPVEAPAEQQDDKEPAEPTTPETEELRDDT